MTTTLEEPPEALEHDPESSLPDASVLEDKTPEWCRMSGASAAFGVLLGLVLIVFANRPLWHSDLWDHINYGFHTLQHRSVADTEPLLPLAKGMPLVNSAWGSQVVMALVFQTQKLGLPGLQFGYALLIVVAMGFVGYAVTRRSGSVVAGMMSSLILLAVNWQQFLIIRPQLAGVCFFCAVLAMLVLKFDRRQPAWFVWPVLFAVWANVHGSFAMGLFLMGLYTIGTAMDLIFSTRSLRQTLASRRLWKLILLTQLSATAVLLNPNGLTIYHEVLRVGSHPNVQTMYEWDPLTLRMKQGQAFAAAAVVLLLLLRLSPRRLRSAELLPLLVLGLMAMWSGRMINWFAPLAGLMIGCHGAAVCREFTGRLRRTVPYQRTGLWTVVNLGLCWVFFGLTALGVQSIHGRAPDVRRSLSAETPISLLEYLSTNDDTVSRGVAFVPAEWSGFLMQFGPPTLKPMVNLHVHVIPEEVWTDYVRLLEGPGDWDGLLDRYAINMAITNKITQARLTRLLRESDQYEIKYEDAQAAVFHRKHPIP